MLTLQNFETQINSAILQRGKQYYSSKAITWLEETIDNTWQAEVEGLDMYQVNVKLEKENETSEYFCDCPYYGNTCKHVAAVLYALRDELKKNKRPQKSKSKKMYSKACSKLATCPKPRNSFAIMRQKKEILKRNLNYIYS